MELYKMSQGIIKQINGKYSKDIIKDCLDLTQMLSICNLYKNMDCQGNMSISLNEIDISSPKFKKTDKIKDSANVLESNEFQKKYSFFIKIIYACLKIDIELFDIVDGSILFKNNYSLIKSIELQKKKIIMDHMTILKNQHRSISQKINQTYYDEYIPAYIAKNKIIDKILESIKKLIKANVITNSDNLFELILPYFYTYSKYIEEYN
jgi:hypothetical protein